MSYRLCFFALLATGLLRAQGPCAVSEPMASFTIHHISGHPELTLNPGSSPWRKASTQSMFKDCSRQIEYPKIKSTVHAFWTDTDLYLLFECPYKDLNLFLPADHSQDHVGLWDRDVVEMFLGDDWSNIKVYREFEIAPTGDWVDLAIDLGKESYDPKWNSGWETKARIDQVTKTWYAAARIPLSAVSSKAVTAGTKWRANLYRIEGLGPDSQRHFLCWQPTCVQNRDPNHVPEHFGAIEFAR